jgi:hypothetical protein
MVAFKGAVVLRELEIVSTRESWRLLLSTIQGAYGRKLLKEKAQKRRKARSLPSG